MACHRQPTKRPVSPTTHPVAATAAATAADHDPVESGRRTGRARIHRAWFVATVTFVTIIGAAAFRSLPGLPIDPLHDQFAW